MQLEITRMVMAMYPKTDKEKQGCWMEIQRMNHLRKIYRERLEAERDRNAKQEVRE